MKVRRQARRESSSEAAAKLFLEFGYERASMNELAKRLRGSKATLYGYFPSKEALFIAVVRAFATAHLSEATADLRARAEGGATLESILLRFAERMLLVLTNDSSALGVYRLVVADPGRAQVWELFSGFRPR